ncbi:MAG: hypothetical protein JO023_16055 [Chloroflexi bacterium]|nr:hypothetical protein [Chloroflexota bacterium]
MFAALLTLATRDGLQHLYEQSVTSVFSQAEAPVAQVAAAPAQSAGAPVLPAGLDDTARAGVDALSPIVDTTRLRGTFLEEADTVAFHEAIVVEAELEELQGALEEQGSLTQVAYRTERVIVRVPEAGGRLFVGAGDRAQADGLWTRAYARDFRQLDTAFGSTLDELDAWRQSDLPGLVLAGRVSEAQQRIERFRAERERMTDRVRALPTPPAASDAARAYVEALRHVDRALALLDDYAAHPAANPSELQDSGDQVAAFRGERQAPLAAVASLGN